MERHRQQGKRAPSTVYWRRRIVLLVIVGVLLWLITGWLFGEDSAMRSAAMRSAGGESGAESGQAGETRTAARQTSDPGGESGTPRDGEETAEGNGAVSDEGRGDGGDRGNGDRRAGAAGRAPSGDEANGTGGDGAGGDGAGSADGAREDGAGDSGAGESGKPAVPRCTADAIDITARPKQESAAAGMPVPFELAVRNHGDRPCRVPPRQEDIRVVVMSGSDRVADTARCAAPTSVDGQRVKPGKSTVVTVRWSGRRDTAACSADAPAAEPGSYTVQASVLGALSEPAEFELR